MLRLDHLVIVAPTLEAGGDYVEKLLGVRPWPGGKHRELGTHNLLLRIGEDVFLEVIAADPGATDHHGPRVFGIGAPGSPCADWEVGRRRNTWVGRVEELEPVVREHGAIVGQMKAVTRGERHWHMAIPADGSLPQAGAVPTPVQYEPGMVPARHMPENCLALRELIVETPRAGELRSLYASLGVVGPVVIQPGECMRLRAFVAGDRGTVEIG